MNSERKGALKKRLDENYTAYIESLQGKTTAELIAMAPEITAAQQVHAGLLDCCDEFDVEFLLRFDDPLEVVREHWKSVIANLGSTEEMDHTLWEIWDKGLYSEEQLSKPQRTTGETISPTAQSKKSNKKERKSHER